jgi:hypothetical protein
MNRQRQIELFSLSLHRLAISRMRAASTLERWRQQAGPTRSDPYFDRWRELLAKGADAIAAATCTDSDAAAALRSVSPLGGLVTPAERKRLLDAARSHEA